MSEKWAYIAGIFDGEGSISMTRTHRKYCVVQCSVRIVNTDKRLIKWLEENIPHSFITRKHHKNNVWSNAEIISIRRQKAIKGFLNKILPYLIVKRRQARLAIEWCNKHIPYKQRLWRKRDSKTGRWLKGPTIGRSWELKYVKEMRRLNQSGKRTKMFAL